MTAMKRRGHLLGWWAAVILAVAAVAVALGWWRRGSPDPVTLAKRAYERGDWQRAADALRGSLGTGTTRSADPETLRVYARALARLQRDEAAAALYSGRLGRTVLEPEDKFLIGMTLVRAGTPEAALEVWWKAMNEGADQPELLDHLARLAFRLQRLDQSAEAARRLARHPGWEARGLFLLGHVQAVIDNPAGAVDALRQALQRDSAAQGVPFDSAFYRRMLARNLMRLGRPAEAQEQLEVLVSPPKGSQVGVQEDPEANWLLSRAHLQQGRIPAAAAALARSGDYGAEHRLLPEPSPYVGSARCAPCHREIHRAYDGTRHTRSFHHDGGLLELPMPDGPLADPDDPKVTHTLARQGQRIEVQTKAGDRVFQMVVAYAFGTPRRYLTMIGRDEQQNYRALRLSSYQTATGVGWGRTSGDVGRGEAIDDVRGQKIELRDGVVRCLYCHVTQSRDYRDPPPEGGPGPEARDPGIGCERCHGPVGNHVQAIEADFPDRAIINVASAPAETSIASCAECHIVGSRSVIESAPEDPTFARSPGLTLTFSRCYTSSSGGMTCLTCHDPHREAEHSASFYEAKCLTCHARPAEAPVAKPAGRRATCPVSPAQDCLGCHMPKVPFPDLHTSLTDHSIRVRK
jgi:tetratricopeptide (TPR) repeat protein